MAQITCCPPLPPHRARVSSWQQTSLLCGPSMGTLGSCGTATHTLQLLQVISHQSLRYITGAIIKLPASLWFAEAKVKITLHSIYSTFPSCFVNQHSIEMQEDSLISKSNTVIQIGRKQILEFHHTC